MKRLIEALVISTLITGCSSIDRLSDNTVLTNKVQEEASNKLLVLNIIRASKRKPLHFTQIEKINLPVGFGNTNFSFPIQFGGDRTNLYTLTTEIERQPFIDHVLLNSQEFMRGIMASVDASLLLYYLSVDWPQQIILHLFVSGIDFYKGNKIIDTIENAPENKKEFDLFQNAMNQIRNCKFTPMPEITSLFYSKAFAKDELDDLVGLAAIKNAGLVPIKTADSYGRVDDDNAQIRFAKQEISLSVQLMDYSDEAKCAGVISPKTKQGFRSFGFDKEAPVPQKPIEKKGHTKSEDAKEQNNSAEIKAVLKLRSPEAMIYYLGEIVRVQQEGHYGELPNTRLPAEPNFPSISFGEIKKHEYPQAILFRLDTRANKYTSSHVEYEGLTYSISNQTVENRSMHVLSLLTQILALQNKGTLPPSTTNVRVLR